MKLLLAVFIILLSIEAHSQTDSVKISSEELIKFRSDQVKLDRCSELLRQEKGHNFVLRDKAQLERNKFVITEHERKNLARNIKSLQLNIERVKKTRWLYFTGGSILGTLGFYAVSATIAP